MLEQSHADSVVADVCSSSMQVPFRDELTLTQVRYSKSSQATPSAVTLKASL